MPPLASWVGARALRAGHTPSMEEPIVKSLMLVFAAVLLAGAGAAEAAQVTCSGSYFGYDFTVRSNVARNRLSGKINILVVNRSQGFRQSGTMTPTSSDIRPGKHLRFSGRGPDGATGSVDATHSGGSSYQGTLHASASAGSVNVPVACRLTGRSLMIEELEYYDWAELGY